MRTSLLVVVKKNEWLTLLYDSCQFPLYLTKLFLKFLFSLDLKYENIMFANNDPGAEVKIIDFGLSKKYADNSYLHDTVGTV